MFVTVVVSVQYRACQESAHDAFYKLSRPREQIKAYVFDGKICPYVSWTKFVLLILLYFSTLSYLLSPFGVFVLWHLQLALLCLIASYLMH